MLTVFTEVPISGGHNSTIFTDQAVLPFIFRICFLKRFKLIKFLKLFEFQAEHFKFTLTFLDISGDYDSSVCLL